MSIIKSICFAVCISFIVSITMQACSSKKEVPNVDIKFEEIGKGPASGIYENKQVVLRNESDYKKELTALNSIFFPEPESPSIDFNKYIVIAAFMGTRNNGGYGVKIDKVRYDDDGNLKVTVIETSPGSNCVTTDAITHPYHMVKIPKTGAKVVFDVKQEVFNCR